MIDYIPIINVLKIVGLAFVINKFDPIKWVFEAIIGVIPENNITLIFLKLFVQIILKLLTCLNCTSFWLGTILFGIWYGVISFFITFLYQRFIGDWVESEKLQ